MEHQSACSFVFKSVFLAVLKLNPRTLYLLEKQSNNEPHPLPHSLIYTMHQAVMFLLLLLTMGETKMSKPQFLTSVSSQPRVMESALIQSRL